MCSFPRVESTIFEQILHWENGPVNNDTGEVIGISPENAIDGGRMTDNTLDLQNNDNRLFCSNIFTH